MIAAVLLVLQVQQVLDVKELLANSVFAKSILPIIGPEFDKALRTFSAPGKDAAKIVLPNNLPVKKP